MKQIVSIQVLRAVAALMIVLAHAQDDALGQATRLGLSFAKWDALPWDAGVDLFFVISGFIMVHASERLFTTHGAAGQFLQRRLIRIVPLYWLVTAIVVAILVMVAAHNGGALPGIEEIVSSFGFLPFARPGDGAPRPLAAIGWTLNYEMFFYAVFACFIGLRRNAAILGASLALILAVTLGTILRPSQTALAYWSDPIILEFAIGMGIAWAYATGMRLPRPLTAAVVCVAVVALARDGAGMNTVANFTAKPNGFPRLLACGLPMAALFAAIVLARVRPSSRPAWAFGARLGDASYALYLFHPFVIVLARKAYLALGLAQPLGFWPLIVADLPLAVALSLVVHAFVERPAHHRLTALARGPRRVASRPALDPSLPST